ncbi:MAG: DUF488 family protein [Deltaproteobacteria bacterium]|nr:DUF488 family protein [Deltaproteobacteria bacterium]
MIKTKSIYEAPSDDDGLRVLVTRYWPRGVKKEVRALWVRELGPESELIKRWKSGAMSWAEFKAAYSLEHKGHVKKTALDELRQAMKADDSGVVTLLCVCADEKRCHRTILKRLLDGG